MKNGTAVRTVTYVIWISFVLFLSLSFSQARGEHLFRWRDDAGRLCYSNVSPPAGMKAYSVDIVSHPAPDRSPPVRISTDAAEKMPAETVIPHSDSSGAFLKQRIMDRKTSIGQIEALLRKHPNDSVLRKRLFRKKQYLFEDLTRLKNGQP